MNLILSIETSCDETSIAILKNGNQLLSHLISSQIKSHQPYGGVVPELASRLHAEVIHSLIDQALHEAKITLSDLSCVAVTMGPGLEGSLLVGVSVAKTIATYFNIPLIPVNHLHGHLYAQYDQTSIAFPYCGLIISGGHTSMVHVKDHGQFELIGQTRDDAAGEVFDKVARCLGLGYPGGPVVEKEARQGDPKRFSFPIPMKHSPFEFSFSGLKTAAIQIIQSFDGKPLPVQDICASFQYGVIQALLYKVKEACQSKQLSHVLLSGGVSANQTLVTSFKAELEPLNIQVTTIAPKLCTDNAAMIAYAAYYLSEFYPYKDNQILADSSLPICT